MAKCQNITEKEGGVNICLLVVLLKICPQRVESIARSGLIACVDCAEHKVYVMHIHNFTSQILSIQVLN